MHAYPQGISSVCEQDLITLSMCCELERLLLIVTPMILIVAERFFTRLSVNIASTATPLDGN